jgi:formamidopyrimidine-DNA glycosylase
MPELPEVETTRRGIVKQTKEQVITKVIIREKRLRWPIPDDLSSILPGQQIEDVNRRGKYLLLKCTSGYIIIHLGMSGHLRVLDSNTAVKKHDHVDIVLSNGLCLRYHDPRRFGCVLWTSDAIFNHPLLVKLGPEPLEVEFTGEYLYSNAQKRRMAVKNYIMNAHVVVGVGNIYANEALFLAGIHPACSANEVNLKRYQNLVQIIKQVLQAAIEKGGTTLRDFVNTSGNPGYFQQSLLVYARAGEPCVKCGEKLLMEKIGQRATYYCYHCQQL